MNRGSTMKQTGGVLGIEGGGTRTSVLLAQEGRARFSAEFGPGNVRLLDDAGLRALFRDIALATGTGPAPDAIAFGMAGARTAEDRARVARLAAEVWPRAAIRVATDLEIALASAPRSSPLPGAQVLVLSGTGSCCFGRSRTGRTEKVGGWGHHLGDQGSGHALGKAALQRVVAEWDRRKRWGRLGRELLATLQLNEPNDLIGWVQSAEKKEVARLAETVFQAATAGDALARAILRDAADELATDALIVADRLVPKGRAVQFLFAGGVLLKGGALARRVAATIRKRRPTAILQKLERPSVWGAVTLAEEALAERAAKASSPPERGVAETRPAQREALSPTELRHPASMRLDAMPVEAAVELFLKEDARITAGLLAEKAAIARVVGWVARAFKRGGRLFYAGAGTSGRLGILDASECPPTFRTPPEMVQGIIAGGREAIWRAVEGAEDDPAAGARAIQFRGVTDKDVVVGIAASGRTPFVRGVLAEAKTRGAHTVLVCFNPHVHAEKPRPAEVVIAPDIGSELLTGSTRLKSGTATKLVLNLFTTLAMVRIGKVIGNLMVDVNPSNVKLRARAIRIVRELTGADEPTAREALEQERWIVRQAYLRLSRKTKRS
jgi:N-acetylmuramic acid 6-phosphate etherase